MQLYNIVPQDSLHLSLFLNMAMVNLVCLFTLVAISSGANIICTDYGKGLGGSVGGYYSMPIPKGCTSDGWYPDYRIKKAGERLY